MFRHISRLHAPEGLIKGRAMLSRSFATGRNPAFTPVLVPDDGYHHLKLLSWTKKERDFVEQDEELCEIDTPDYVLSVTAPFQGFVAQIVHFEGEDDLEPGEVLCYLVSKKEELDNKI